MTGQPGRYEVTPEARESVLAILGSNSISGPPGMDSEQWSLLADVLIQTALPLLRVVEPATTQRQDELDGEYVLSMRAQANAATLQAEHSAALARLVEKSEELAELQAELTRRQLAEVGGAVNAYTLWKDSMLIAATGMHPEDAKSQAVEALTRRLESLARPIRESLRWAGDPPPTSDTDRITDGRE